jgi:hypothetical protein
MLDKALIETAADLLTFPEREQSAFLDSKMITFYQIKYCHCFKYEIRVEAYC